MGGQVAGRLPFGNYASVLQIEISVRYLMMCQPLLFHVPGFEKEEGKREEEKVGEDFLFLSFVFSSGKEVWK